MALSHPATTGADTKVRQRSELANLEIKPRVGIAYWLSIALAIYVFLVLIEFFVFNENWNWDLIFSYLFSKVIMNGLMNTIILTLITTALGLVLGIITAWCRMSKLLVLRTIAILYIWVMRAMPPLVMLLFVFFFGALVPNLSAAVFGLAIYMGAYTAEIIRGGIMALQAGQFEACKSLGLPPIRAYQKILGPQLIRVITPSMANEIITTFKSTALVSVIGYSELLTTVQTIYSRNFETIPLLTVAVIWYLVLTSLAMYGQSHLEKHFGRGFSRRDIHGRTSVGTSTKEK